MSDFPEKNWGRGSFGGNAVEATSNADAEVRDTSVRKMPLVFDPRTNSYVTHQRKIELDDDEVSKDDNLGHQEEKEFLSGAGFKKNV